MKAIGGATRRVMRLFLAEAALLGLAGGVIGAAAGILLSIWLGKSRFRRGGAPAIDCVSCFRGPDDCCRDNQRLSAAAPGEYFSGFRVSG